jgi:hypothetical protein
MRKTLVLLSLIVLALAWPHPDGWGTGEASNALLQTDLDFGDAEYLATWDGYPTRLAQNGARHLIGGPWLGDGTDPPDTEADGQPNATATGDDINGDDENGVAIPVLFPGFTPNIQVEVSGGGGVVEAWIDFNHDRQWAHPGEQVFAGYLPDGIHSVPVTVASSAVIGQTTARVRISTAGGLTPTGQADDGEVEDHIVTIEDPPRDFGDAPDGVGAALYPTLLIHNGARHVTLGPWLGDSRDAPDADADGQPHANGLGDDNDGGGDDEDGVQIPALLQGHPADLTVQVSGGGGIVEGWIDFNADHRWQHPGEQVVSGYFADGIHTVPTVTPADAEVGQTFARFRISEAGGLAPDGVADEGEVEDYEVMINYKWEQLPDLDSTSIAATFARAGIPHPPADDFECRQSGYITGIQFWMGSWNDNYPPMWGNLENPRVYILSNLPDSMSASGFSQPDTILWSRDVWNDIEYTIWDADIVEGWVEYDHYTFPADTACWLATISIPPEESFYQTGTPENPVVYWLHIQGFTHDGYARFGWKASSRHGLSGAVWGTAVSGDWYQLQYPEGHPFAGQPMDMAFRVISEPGLEFDWGDAPDGLETSAYPTLLVNDGARHVIAGPWLGDAAGGPDGELDGQPHTQALGDDNLETDDEGGVQIPVLKAGELAKITIDVSGGGGYVQGWIDFNIDQSWDAGEMIVGQVMADGSHELLIPVLVDASLGTSFARFRISSVGDLEPTGHADDGEVEDYEVSIQDPGTGVETGAAPSRYELYQCVPNPFNPATAIRYDVPAPGGQVTIRIYDVAGRLVRTLVDGVQTPGQKEAIWDGRAEAGGRVASGVYFYRLTAGTFERTRKMVLVQ